MTTACIIYAEARRVLPRLRFFAKLVQYENNPLPSDDELVTKEAARLQRFASSFELHRFEGENSERMLELYRV